MEPTTEQIEQISQSIRDGRKIEAIKTYRAATGLGLAEAKNFIERLETELREKDPNSFKTQPQSQGCGASAVIMAIFGIALATLVGGILALVG